MLPETPAQKKSSGCSPRGLNIPPIFLPNLLFPTLSHLIPIPDALCCNNGYILTLLITASPWREGEPLLLGDEERKRVVGVTENGLVSSPRAVRGMNALLGLSVLFVWGKLLSQPQGSLCSYIC